MIEFPLFHAPVLPFFSTAIFWAGARGPPRFFFPSSCSGDRVISCVEAFPSFRSFFFFSVFSDHKLPLLFCFRPVVFFFFSRLPAFFDFCQPQSFPSLIFELHPPAQAAGLGSDLCPLTSARRFFNFPAFFFSVWLASPFLVFP